MLRRPDPTPPDDAPGRPSAAVRDLPDLSGLAIAGLTRRRTAFLIGTLLAVWIVIVFARQVGSASAASARAEQMAVENVQISAEVAAYERELELIQRQRYIEQEARRFGLGASRETSFTLAPGAPPLPDDAPGSASVRLGAEATRISPLERWLSLLFGPGD